MPAKVFKLGPGTLKLGPTDTQLDISCQITNAVLSPEKDTEDPVTVLCGDTVPGASTYNWTLSGTAFVDLTEGGIVDWTWQNENKIAAFEFVPNDEAAATFAGNVVIDPLAVGGDSGKNMTQDFEWSCSGRPTPIFTPSTEATFPSPTTFPSTRTWPQPLTPAPKAPARTTPAPTTSQD